jgi:hypothetical protein
MPRSDKLVYSSQLLSPKTPPSPKKKHVCSTCQRSFTTSAHLARHSRVHTGERNRRRPFPGCETRCSRQDNLQQQSVPFFVFISPCTNSILFSYRIHLSPGSCRVSIRSTSRKRVYDSTLPKPHSRLSTRSLTPQFAIGADFCIVLSWHLIFSRPSSRPANIVVTSTFFASFTASWQLQLPYCDTQLPRSITSQLMPHIC